MGDRAREAFMEIAWRDFILWAYRDADVLAQYRAETGRELLPPAARPIDAAIDAATGANEASMKAFVFWATERLWGIEDAPAKLRDAIESGSERAGDRDRPDT